MGDENKQKPVDLDEPFENTTVVELDLDDDVYEDVTKVAKEQGFISRGELIRHILREAIKNNSL